MQVFAQIISYVLHPVLMPVYGMGILIMGYDEVSQYSQTNPMKLMYLVASISGLAIMMSLILKNLNYVSSLDTLDPTERVYLYGVGLFCFGIVYVMLMRNDDIREIFHPALFKAYFGAVIAMAICLVVTFFYRISAHMVGIAGVLGMCYAVGNQSFYSNPLLLVGIMVIAGVIGTARMIREAHDMKQIVLGFAVGFLSTYLSISL